MVQEQLSFPIGEPKKPVNSWPKAVDLMERWRQVALLSWSKVLTESIREGDKRREAFARNMLSEVLQDLEYKDIP